MKNVAAPFRRERQYRCNVFFNRYLVGPKNCFLLLSGTFSERGPLNFKKYITYNAKIYFKTNRNTKLQYKNI